MNVETARIETAKNQPGLRPSDTRPKRLRFRDADTGQEASQGGRLLYGGFCKQGVCIEWHHFQMERPFEWSRSFRPGSLELCINLVGQGCVQCGEGVLQFEPLTAGCYLPGQNGLQATRHPGQPHRFAIIGFSAGFLREHLGSCDGALDPIVERFLTENPDRGDLGHIHRLTSEQEQLAARLPRPSVAQAARGLWYRSKVLQLVAEFFFERGGTDELFCDRQKRVARERVDRVIAILRQDLVQPPGLEELGRRAGCSPFHLSRTFSQEMHMTIPQYLRKIRMERAAELLRSGKYNVTEAAMEVGYSSLSHFSLAFCQTMGCCPGLYPPAWVKP